MKKQNAEKYDLIPIYSLDEIPAFSSEDEERDWWDTHEFSDELWDSLPHERDPDLERLQASPKRTEINSWGDVPEFSSEDEERAWWDVHVPSVALLDGLPERPILPSRLETLRGFVRIGRAQAARKRKVS